MKREDVNFLLQELDEEELEPLFQKIKESYPVQINQDPTPQTLLLPVADPVTEGQFHGGEVLVTTCFVKVNDRDGWAMVMDNNRELALRIAVIDGAYDAGYYADEIRSLMEKGNSIRNELIARQNKDVNSTRVNFDLMAAG